MITENLERIKKQLPKGVQLVVVSKFRPVVQLNEVYNAGQRDLGENRVQEMINKYEEMPKDIRWHMIGHLQTNKVKYIAPFVSMIHSVDSFELAVEINKQAIKNKRIIPVLIQFHIALEESKFGFKPEDPEKITAKLSELKNIEIKGLMGMASLSADTNLIRNEFRLLRSIFDTLKELRFKESGAFDTLSMGMSGDFKIAVEEGSTLVRIGSMVFE